MAQTGPFLDPGEIRRALMGLLERQGVNCGRDDILVIPTQTRRGNRVHVVIAANSAERPLASLVARVADRRNMMVGVPGVFVLRPDDIQQLLSNVRT